MTNKQVPFAKRRARLKTIQDVGIEMARVYRRCKGGEMPTAEGYRMVMMLAALKQCLESSDLRGLRHLLDMDRVHHDQELERRIVEIETILAARGANIVPYTRPTLLVASPDKVEVEVAP
jgi:hypothetical protein